MADEKPKAAPDKPDKGIDRPQDPIVDRLKRDPVPANGADPDADRFLR